MPRRLSWQSQSDAGHLEHVTVRTAAFVVAASDASDGMKSQADWICTGVADDVDIQEAIDALPAGGGKVVLSAGTFNLTAPVTAVGGLTLAGQGYATQLKVTTGIILVSADTVDNIVVRDMRLTGNNTTTTQQGVTLESVNDGRLEGLHVEDMGYDGIQLLTGCNRIIVTNNWVDNCGDDGINVGGGTTPATGDIIVTNNHVWGCTASGIHCSWGSADMTISNNVVGTCGGNGIDLELESDGAKRATVTGNVVTDISYHGICVDGTAAITDVIILGNMLEDINNNGIRVDADSDRFLIAFNVLKNCQVWGIVVTQDNDADRQINITGNIIDGEISSGNAGIYVSKSSKAQIVFNSIMNIHVDASAIKEANCSGALIMGNRVEEPIVVGGAATVVKDNPGYVTENSDTSTGTGAEQTIAHGLATTPTRVYFSNIEDGANPYQSSAADGTNIYVTAVTDKDYVWKAEVV